MLARPAPTLATVSRVSVWLVFLWFVARFIVDGLIKVFQINWAATGWGDCRVDWAAARLFLEHKSPYTEEALTTMGLQNYGFGHPPTTSFWFIPLAKVGYPVMAEIVAVLTLVALLFHLIICAHELQLPAKTAFVLLSFGLVLRTTWMDDHLILVQVSAIIAFFLVLAWYFLRRGREIEAGITLGLACTLKLFPGVLVLFFLVTRRFRGFAAACLAYLSVAAIMTSGYGWGAWKEFFRQQGPIASYWMGHIRNASLHGIIVRLFRPLCERPPDDATALDIVGTLRKLPSIPPIPGARWAMFASLTLLGLCFWIARRAAPRDRAVDVPYALFCAVAVFINPWIWEHYDVLLLMPVSVLMAGMMRRAREVRRHLGQPERKEAFARSFGELLFLLLAVTWIVALLAVDTHYKSTLYEQYWSFRNANQPIPPGMHRRVHLLEVLNWLPWVVAIAALATLLIFDQRKEHRIGAACYRSLRFRRSREPSGEACAGE